MRISWTCVTVNSRILALLSLILCATSWCSGANITYDVNQALSAGSVTGDIVTDGTIGGLINADFVDWDLSFNLNPYSFNLTRSLNNYLFTPPTLFVSATSTQLLFDFNQVNYLDFYNPLLGFICWEGGTNGNCAGGTTSGIVVSGQGYGEFLFMSGTHAIATTSSAPEPSTLALLGPGIGLLGFRRLRR